MNLKSAKRILDNAIKNFNSNDLGFEYSIEGDHVSATADLSLAGHDDNVMASFQVYENGMVFFNFLFDNLERNETTLGLIEDFNENVLFLKAEMGDGLLTLSCNAPCLTEESLADFTVGVLNELVDEETKKYLTPLTDLTTSDSD